MGLYSGLRKFGRGVGKVVTAPVSATAGLGGFLAGAATGDMKRAADWSSKAFKKTQQAGGFLGEVGTTGGLAVAEEIARQGARENQAKAQTLAPQTASATPTDQPSTGLSPITVLKPTAITSILGNQAAGIEGAKIPEEMRAALQMRKEALGGFSAPALAAQYSQMGLQQAAAEKARQRQLSAGLARSGVRGGAAGAAQARAAQLAGQERAAQAQEMFLVDLAQKEKALSDYEKSTGQALSAAQKQQFMELAADITGQQLGVARETGKLQAEAIGKFGTAMTGKEEAPGFFSNFWQGLT